MAWHQPLLSGGPYFSISSLIFSEVSGSYPQQSPAASEAGSEYLPQFINTECFRKKIPLTEVTGAMLTLCSPQQQNQAG